MTSAPLDANAAAGYLAEVFAFDVTAAITKSASCHRLHPVGALHAYLDAPGLVLRCASCQAVQLRFVRSAERGWLDVRGIEVLQIPLTEVG